MQKRKVRTRVEVPVIATSDGGATECVAECIVEGYKDSGKFYGDDAYPPEQGFDILGIKLIVDDGVGDQQLDFYTLNADAQKHIESVLEDHFWTEVFGSIDSDNVGRE